MTKPATNPSPNQAGNKNLLHNVMFGGVAGVIGQSSVYPLYTIKTHLHLYPTQYTNFLQAGAKICRETGFRSLYRGIRPALIGVFPEKAIKLSVNDYLTAVLSRSDGTISVPMAMLAGAGAGLSQVVATNPMELLMINMQKDNTNRPMRHLVSDLGISGLYKGVAATLFRDIPFSMVFFSTNTFLRTALTDENKNLSMSKVFLAGISSGSIAATISTPADVIKTHLQATTEKVASVKVSSSPMPSNPTHVHRSSSAVPASARRMSSTASPVRYTGILHCAKHIYATEGITGFFAGVGPRILTISPLFGITLFFYDIQRRLQQSGKI